MTRNVPSTPFSILPLMLAVALLGAYCGGGGSGTPEGPIHDTGLEYIGPVDAVVAEVGGDSVTLGEVNLLAGYWMGMLPIEERASLKKKDFQEQALENLIAQLLLAQEARRRGIVLTDSERRVLSEQWHSGFASASDESLALAAIGVTGRSIEESIFRDELIRRLGQSAIGESVVVLEDEVRAYYEEHAEEFDSTQVRTSHILVQVKPDATEEEVAAAEKKIRSILDRVRNGEDFADLARQYSDCPSSARGGDLGFVGRGRLVPEFEKAAFSLDVGQVSDVVRTRFGFHIIKVTGRKGDRAGFDEVAGQIRQQLREAKIQEGLDRLGRSLRETAEVRVLLPHSGKNEK